MLLGAALIVVFLMLLPSPGSAAPTVTGFVPVAKGRLWYEARGEGPALVMVHDGLLPSETWDAQVEPFARHFRVVRYDRRRYGRSTTETDDFSNVDDLKAVLDHLHLSSVVLLGCSSGGGLALDFAVAQKDRVSALVLVGPVVSGFGYSGHFNERGLRNAAPVYVRKDKDAAVANWATDRYITDARNEAARARLLELFRRFPFSAAGGNPGGRPAPPALSHLSDLRIPTLILSGESDIPDVQAHIGAIASRLPWVERQVMPVAGHLPHLEQPQDFNRRVLDYLAPEGHVAEVLQGLREGPSDLQAFAYDAAAPLDVRESGRETRGVVGVRDLSYASPLGGRVSAFLIAPENAQHVPAVLFLHHGQGDRKTFVDEAVELAQAGLVSLLIDAPGYRGEDDEGPPYDAAHDRAEIVQTVVDLRRGFDLLASRAEADPARLGYVGYSLGATMGARLLGVEPRVRASVMIAGFPALTLDYSRGDRRAATSFRGLVASEEARRAYLAALAPLDGVRFLSRRTPAPLLLQFARSDEFISRLDAALFARAAGGSPEASLYDGGHFALGSGAPREERRAFLLRSLVGIPPPPR